MMVLVWSGKYLGYVFHTAWLTETSAAFCLSCATLTCI